jgi:hypothetical protein
MQEEYLKIKYSSFSVSSETNWLLGVLQFYTTYSY